MNKDDYIKQFEDDLTPEMILALDLLQEDKLISIEDELPKEHTDCTIKLINDMGYKIGFYDKIYKCFYEKIYLQEKP